MEALTLTQLNRRRWAVQLALSAGLALLCLAALLWGVRGVTPARANSSAFYAVGAASNMMIAADNMGFTVTSVFPPPAACNVVPSTMVSATFNLAVNFSTVNTRTFTVRGDQTGIYKGTYMMGSVQFDPAQDFKPGEKVMVSLSSGLQATDTTSFTPYTWQFWAAAAGGSGLFDDSGQNLGNSQSRGVALGDLDGDDDLDAFVGNASEANKVWLNDGTGVFTDSGQSLGTSGSMGIALGDLDRDGDLDAFIGNEESHANKVWLNTTSSFTGTRYVDDGSGSDDSTCSDPAAPCATIGYALNQAVNGDEILVAAGVYTETLDIFGNPITLRGGHAVSGTAWLPQGETIIDANGADCPVITIGPGNTVTIEGFTVQGANHVSDYGGGFFIQGATVTISDAVIRANTTANSGAGVFVENIADTPDMNIYLINSSVISNNATNFPAAGAGLVVGGQNSIQVSIENTSFTGNIGAEVLSLQQPFTIVGGQVSSNTVTGPAIAIGDTGVISGTEIVSNTSDAMYIGHDADGVLAHNLTIRGNIGQIWNSGAFTLTDSIIENNSFDWSLIVSENYSETNRLVLDNCTLRGNSSGGIAAITTGYAALRNTRIVGNDSDRCVVCSGEGETTPTVEMVNVLLADNEAQGQVTIGNSTGSTRLTNVTLAGNVHGDVPVIWAGSTMTVTNTILWGNTTSAEDMIAGPGILSVSYSDIEGGWTGADNLNVDPQFVAPSHGDYHLLAGSPCIDSGTATGAPDHDLDGLPRPQSIGYDMGAYEFEGTPTHEATPDRDGFLLSPDAAIVVYFPAGAVDLATDFVLTPMASLPSAIPGGLQFAGIHFELAAFREGNPVTDLALDEPVLITLHYSDADVLGLDGTELSLYRWDGGAWATDPPIIVERDPGRNRLVVHVLRLGQFALFGPQGCVAASLMHIVGPAQGHTGVPYVFSAVITPTAASLPITYTWQPEPTAGQNTPNAVYTWGSVGVYSVSVSVTNCQATTSSSQTTTVSVIPPPAAAAGDAYEADDTCAEASAIEVTGASQVHTLHASADIDWVAFPATAGTTYVIQARVPPTSTADVNLELYEACDGDGRDDQDPTFAADVRVTFRAVRSGDHYLRLRNSDPNVYGSDAVYHLAVQPAQTSANGAVVLVAGKLKDDDPVQPNIHHVTNAVYQLALDNGCTADDVYYLGSDTALPGVDAEATAANLQQAITGWARDRIGAAKRFTLYLMDHGGADTFYLNYVDGQAVTVTPGQLDTWLSQLEGDVPDVEANVIIEACYSGSFIEPEHTVSRSGRERLVMASTGPSALAYATGDGALFSDKFLGELARGDSLQLAFEESRWAALQAHADQTPWLDVDGDGTPNEAEDMAIARARGFACAAVPTVEKWAPYISNVWVRTLSDGNIGIWAKAQDDKDATGLGVKDVWAVVYPPSYTPPSQSEELVQEADLGLPPLPMLATNTDDLYGTFYPAFSETGIYRVVIHAVDEEGLVARPQVVEVQSGQPQHWVYLPLVLKQD